jgi:hypothetical protein
MTSCSDCGILYELSLKHQEEHPEVCCDCFDQTYGMPDKCRGIPRPQSGEFICLLKLRKPEFVKFVGKGSTPEMAVYNARKSRREYFDLIRELI